MVLENYYQRWKKEAEIRRDNPGIGNKKLFIKRTKKSDVVKVDETKYWVTNLEDHPELQPKFTDPHSGQEKWGGEGGPTTI